MNPKFKYYCGALASLLRQLPTGHIVAASSLSVSLLIAAAYESPLKNEQNSAYQISLIDEPELSVHNSPILPNAPIYTPLTLPSTDSLFPPAKAVSIVSTESKVVEPKWSEQTVKSGDTISNVFARSGLNNRDIYELFDGSKEAKALRNITPGQKIAFLIDSNAKLLGLKFTKNELDTLTITRTNSSFLSKETSIKPEIRQAYREGTINSSLFVAAKQAGLPTNLTMDMANIFGYDIDFALDIKKGDSFKVIYEEKYVEGKRITTGDILTAEFTNDGKTYRAVRYTNKDGVTRYYAADGKGMNKAFLRTPVDFARISSSFSLGRLHPILNTIRAHKGTDYAAATGTPIRATGDGKVIFAGRQGGYGNCIVIQHGQGYETLYGHMSSFGKSITTGSRVSQGQIIGAVGMTGLASGPHLHYEFHVGGQVRDPVTVQLPQSMGIAANEKSRFMAATQTIVALLDTKSKSNIALGESKTKSN